MDKLKEQIKILTRKESELLEADKLPKKKQTKTGLYLVCEDGRYTGFDYEKDVEEAYKKLLEEPSSNNLSQSALETLAIIAYNEPITRIEVDEIRGVDSAYTVRRLLAKGLIKECGRKDMPGHPILYKTTDEFLDYFGLASKEDLPKIEALESYNEDKELYTSTYKDS